MKTIEEIMGLVEKYGWAVVALNDAKSNSDIAKELEKVNEISSAIESALRELMERQQKDKIDADCFRWWANEAEANPSLVAKAISNCVTEDDYRLVICGAMQDAKAAIKMAQKG